MGNGYSVSKNPDINEFILNDGKLKWIPYEQITNIKYLAQGGFSVVSKAKWGFRDVVLKSINNSKHLTVDILQEITNYKRFNHEKDFIHVAQCYGISQDPETKNYLMVMNYFKNGTLRQYLNENYEQLSLKDKVGMLYSMTNGLFHIHFQRLIHKDFHPGNILIKYSSRLRNISCYITDLGLCKPIDEADDSKQTYGVLPYIAPEVLKGEPYTQASDIYSWGIVAYELLSGLRPYSDIPHDGLLAIDICNGLRPNLDIVNVPQLLKILIIKCWDDNPQDRPKIQELFPKVQELFHFYEWYFDQDSKFHQPYHQIEVAKKSLKLTAYNDIIYQTHPQAIYTSRLFDLNLISKTLNLET